MDFKIFCILTVKNECDIVGDVISSALTWANKIIVMDNCSDDGTLNVLEDISEKNSNVILWGVFNGMFKDSLRQRVYQDFKYLAKPGDWWCRLDADEFYIDSPRNFISSLSSDIDFINSASFQYYFTAGDLAKSSSYKDLSYYKCNWSEIRFFKHSDKIIWPSVCGWPINLKNRSRKFIRLKHYQYRGLKQIKERVSIRMENASLKEFLHETGNQDEWYRKKGFSIPNDTFFIENKIVNESDLNSSKDFIIDNGFYNKFNESNVTKIKRMLFIFVLFIISPLLRKLKVL